MIYEWQVVLLFGFVFGCVTTIAAQKVVEVARKVFR